MTSLRSVWVNLRVGLRHVMGSLSHVMGGEIHVMGAVIHVQGGLCYLSLVID